MSATRTACAVPGCPMDAKGECPFCMTHWQLTPAKLRGEIERCRVALAAAPKRKAKAIENRRKAVIDEAAAVVAAREKA